MKWEEEKNELSFIGFILIIVGVSCSLFFNNKYFAIASVFGIIFVGIDLFIILFSLMKERVKLKGD